MSRISMRGYDDMDGLCAALPELLDKRVGPLKRCRLVESTRRDGAAFMLFLCHNKLVRGDWPFAVGLRADGDGLIADAMAGGRFFDSYSERLLEFTAEILRRRGFEEFQRESWVLESDRDAERTEMPSLDRVAVSGGAEDGNGRPGRGEKRGYDPEL